MCFVFILTYLTFINVSLTWGRVTWILRQGILMAAPSPQHLLLLPMGIVAAVMLDALRWEPKVPHLTNQLGKVPLPPWEATAQASSSPSSPSQPQARGAVNRPPGPCRTAIFHMPVASLR